MIDLEIAHYIALGFSFNPDFWIIYYASNKLLVCTFESIEWAILPALQGFHCLIIEEYHIPAFVRELICSFADTWANIAMCHSIRVNITIDLGAFSMAQTY